MTRTTPWTPAQVARLYEAAAGDLDDDGVEPIFLSARATGEDHVRLRMKITDRVMRATVEILDPRLDLADVAALFCEAYLRTYTMDYWREHADVIELVAGEVRTRFAYPERAP